MNTDFMRRSAGVSSGKLAAHSVPESCFWKSLSAGRIKSTDLPPPPLASSTCAAAISNPTACAEILYCPRPSGGKTYFPDGSVYTVVVNDSVELRAETPTPSKSFPSADFTVPDRKAFAETDCENISCAPHKR